MQLCGSLSILWPWNENWPFPVLWPLLSFPNLLAYRVQPFHSIIFQDLTELHWQSITSTSFFVVMLRPTWLHIPGCLIICEWSHHRDYLDHEDLSGTVLWILVTSSLYLLLLLGPYHFCLNRAHLCMKWSLGISNFLEEISSLFHSAVFLYFFALFAPEGCLISPWYSLERCVHCLYLSFFPLLFFSLLFTAICKASSDSHFAFLPFFFLGMVLIPVPV